MEHLYSKEKEFFKQRLNSVSIDLDLSLLSILYVLCHWIVKRRRRARLWYWWKYRFAGIHKHPESLEIRHSDSLEMKVLVEDKENTEWLVKQKKS